MKTAPKRGAWSDPAARRLAAELERLGWRLDRFRPGPPRPRYEATRRAPIRGGELCPTLVDETASGLLRRVQALEAEDD